MVGDYLWLARSLALRFRSRGQEPDDLLQVARIGLVEACDRFDPERGAFTPFAVATIIGVLRRHFRDCAWAITPPRRTQELAVVLRQQWPAIVQELDSLPDDRSLATILEQPVEEIHRAQQALTGYSISSIDALPVEPGVEARDFGEVEARLAVQQMLTDLSEADRELLYLRLWEERTQSDIAARTGTSQMQVSRRLARLYNSCNRCWNPRARPRP